MVTLEPFSRGATNLKCSAARSITDAHLNVETKKKILLTYMSIASEMRKRF